MEILELLWLLCFAFCCVRLGRFTFWLVKVDWKRRELFDTYRFRERGLGKLGMV